MTGIGRINAVDALRGFAISAIILIHSSNHFLYSGIPKSSPEWLLQLDEILKSFLYFIFEGKAYSSLPCFSDLLMHFDWTKGCLKAWI